MQVKHLDHVNMTVRSFKESVDWYLRVFGFRLVEENTTEGVHWGVIRSGEAMLCLYEYPDREFADRFELGRKGLFGVSHFALRIQEVESWLETARREEVTIQYGGEVAWPHSRSWYVQDPTGYEIEVVAWENDAVAFEPLRG